MSGADPISQFFPGHEDDDDVLYTALGVPKDAPLTDITVRPTPCRPTVLAPQLACPGTF